jgi:predicted ATPase
MAEESTFPEFLLWRHWRQGEHPDVHAFLARFHPLAPTQLAATLRVDQRERWAIGQRVPATDYLRDFPALRDDPEAAIEVIFGEFLLRDRLGESPELCQYQREYPEYAAQLALQVELHRALEGQADEGSAIEARGDETMRPGPDSGIPPAPVAEVPSPPGYEIVDVLGRGGMGVVYKARDIGLGRYVALKFLHPHTIRDGRALARFRREARAASALNHPAICTLYGLGQYQGRPFLVLEWIEGQTLRALAGPHPDLARLLPLVRQVTAALRAAHDAGIVHRDIKPENLMVRPDGFVKVLDFGLARLLPAPAGSGTAPDGVTGTGMLLGTAHYMSPEQARAEPVDAATDIFSLGLVLYELAAGRHPFLADAPLDTMYAIANEPALPPRRLNPEIPAPLEALILQMLEKDPRRRPTAAEVEEALAGLANRSGGLRVSSAAPTGTRPTVGRDQERAALWAGFESAAAGQELFLCVTGEPGIGKTTLVEDFLAELAAGGRAHAVARGRCSERLAGAEAYLPILEALDSLVRGAAGEAAVRAMRLLAPSWYVQVAPPAASDPAADPAAPPLGATQERMKREFLAFLEELSRWRPLVIFLDDVHWADASTVDLLAYLGGRCAGLRLLVLLTYRPTELLLGPHPFVSIQLELQRRGVCRAVPLGFLGRGEVETYLALAFPGHRLPTEFAAVIHAKTEGSPLFLVDLLRYLRDRGVIAGGPGGWSLAQALPNFQRELPESVRSLIQKKLDQLGEVDRRLLAAGSVQGSEFHSGVVARVLSLDTAEVEERLEVLDRVHGLVRLRREQEFPDGTLVLRYQFVHVLYQNALYAALQPTRRSAYSAAVAEALLDHYDEQSASIAGELALLLKAARDWGRAVEFYVAAARNAARIHALREAVALARQGLELVPRLPDTPDRARKELRLQMTFATSLQLISWSDPEVARALGRARELCQQIAETSELPRILLGFWRLYVGRADLQAARALAEELLSQAQRGEDPVWLRVARWALGLTLLHIGDPAAARSHVERDLTCDDRQLSRSQSTYDGPDPRLTLPSVGALSLWLLGYPDQALKRGQEVLALAREGSDPLSLAFILHYNANIHHWRRDARATQECAEALLPLAVEQGVSFWLAGAEALRDSGTDDEDVPLQQVSFWQAGGTALRGWALGQQGRWAEGAAQIRAGINALLSTRVELRRPFYLALLAETLWAGGQIEDGLAVIAEALEVVEATGERVYEAELHRLRGELLLRQAAAEGRPSLAAAAAPPPPHPDPSGSVEAEACFRRALDVARRQGAKSLELRAALSLARLLRGRGQPAEGRRLLAETFAWFTEGWDTPDLQDARAFLEDHT